MQLVIVESPAKANTIKKYLAHIPQASVGEFVVKASVGHIRDLPKSNKNAIDIDAGFVPHYEIVKGKDKVVAELAQSAKKASAIYLATDPDREGEAIAWHIAETLTEKVGVPQEKYIRVVFNAITKEAIEEAFLHTRAIDDNLRHAQEARRVLDRLVGYELSGLIWKKVRYGLSAGRVQSPALRIIMEREREIRAFVPEQYWTLTAELSPKEGGPGFRAFCVEEPRDFKEVVSILEKGRAGKWYVSDIKEGIQKKAPRPPFITSTLQQVASTRLGFSPSRTMDAAQKLYEAGYITYIRTDSPSIAQEALGAITSFIERHYGKNYLEARVYKTK